MAVSRIAVVPGAHLICDCPGYSPRHGPLVQIRVMGSEERFSADTRGRIAIIRIAANIQSQPQESNAADQPTARSKIERQLCPGATAIRHVRTHNWQAWHFSFSVGLLSVLRQRAEQFGGALAPAFASRQETTLAHRLSIPISQDSAGLVDTEQYTAGMCLESVSIESSGRYCTDPGIWVFRLPSLPFSPDLCAQLGASWKISTKTQTGIRRPCG